MYRKLVSRSFTSSALKNCLADNKTHFGYENVTPEEKAQKGTFLFQT